jgi:isocitrate/isopropylmalate dehydrogenase
MNKYKIAVIAGDGIGPEVLAEGIKVLNRVCELDGNIAFEFTHFPWGCEYYLKTGKMMPDDGIETLSKFDAIYLGAVGYPGVPDHISLWDLLLKIRHDFDQYVNLRPVKLLKGFKRICVKAQQTETVKIPVETDDIRFYNPENGDWVLDKEYTVYVGTDSKNASPVATVNF